MNADSMVRIQDVPRRAEGHDVDLLGPSDSSDSGSDVQGAIAGHGAQEGLVNPGFEIAELESNADRSGTGERAGAVADDVREAADILPDQIVRIQDEALETTGEPVDELDIEALLEAANPEDDSEADSEEI